MASITEEQIQQFYKDGFLVLEEFCTTEECDAMREQIHKIVSEMDVPPNCRTVFCTEEEEQHHAQAMSYYNPPCGGAQNRGLNSFSAALGNMLSVVSAETKREMGHRD